MGKVRCTFGTVVLCGLSFLQMTACRSGPSGSLSQPVTITYVGWGPGSMIELKTAKALLGEFTQKTGIQVNYIVGPESVTDRLALYLQWFERKSTTPDVIYTDIIWPGLLAEYSVDLKPYVGNEVDELWRAAVQNDTVDGRLVAIPYNLEIGVLYYRTDLLKKYKYQHPPETWEELAEMAARIQRGERAAGNPDFWGFVWQGAPFEGLTCNALEWQASYGGGKIIEDNGVISVNNPKAIKALKMAKSWIGTISPPSVLAFKEQDSRNVWDAGNAAFRRDWIWRGTPSGTLAQLAVGKFSLTSIPREGNRQASVLGGQSLAVSKYSEHPREAAELVRFLTSRDVQLKLWESDAVLPSVREFYDDPKYLASRPEFNKMRALLTNTGVARPSTVSGKRYADVSEAYFMAVHSVLAGETPPEKAMADLETELVRITGFKTGAALPIPETAAAP